jgi:hypothetical protein
MCEERVLLLIVYVSALILSHQRHVYRHFLVELLSLCTY